MTNRAPLALVAAALFAPLLLSPLLLAPELGIAFVGGIFLLVLAWRSIAYPVALATLPVVAIGLLGSNPFPDNGVALFVFGWIAVAITITLAREQDAFPRAALLSPVIVLSLLLSVWMIARLGPSAAPAYGAFKTQLFIAQDVTLLVAGVLVARRRERFDFFVLLLLGMSALSALLLARGLATGSLEESVGGRFSTSAADSPIELGRDAARGLLLAAYVLLVSRVTTHRLLALLSVPLIAVAFVAAGSRGPVLGLLAGLVVLVTLTSTDWHTRRRTLLLIAGGIVSAVLVSQLVPGQNVQRTLGVFSGSEEGLSSNGRFELWRLAWDAFRDNPLAGVGTGGFAAIAPFDNYPHNVFFEIASELGIVGLALFVGIVAFGARTLLGMLRSGEEDRRRSALVLALLSAALVNSLFSSDLPTNKGVWLSLGLAVGLSMSRDKRKKGSGLLPRFRRGAAGAGGPGPEVEPDEGETRRTGEILSPGPGAELAGAVDVRVRPAVSVWGIAAVQLQRDSGAGWSAVATLEDREYEVFELVGGERHELGALRSLRLAEAFAQALGGERDLHVVPGRRRPWSQAEEVVLNWVTAGEAPGDCRLRLLTIDGAGGQAVSAEIEVRLGTAPVAAPAAAAQLELLMPRSHLRGVVALEARVERATRGGLSLEVGRDGEWATLAAVELPATTLEFDTARVQDGTYDLRVALDGSFSAPVGAVVDNTPPHVELVSPPAGATVTGETELRADAADGTSGIASYLFQFSVGGGPWRPVLSASRGSVQRWSLEAVPAGECAVRVTAFDSAGNHATDTVHVHVAEAAPAVEAPAPAPEPPAAQPPAAQPPAPEPARPPEPEPEPARPPEPEPEPEREPASAPAPHGAVPTIEELERLVEARPDPDPYVQEERRALLYHLREYADIDGTIPESFVPLVDEILEDLEAS